MMLLQDIPTLCDAVDPAEILFLKNLRQVLELGRTAPTDAMSRALAARDWVVHQTLGADALRLYTRERRPKRSALLARLLEGKRPLRHAPPTSHGVPHYALIEDPIGAEHPASIGFSPQLGNGFAIIDQRPWKIVGCNLAASELQELLIRGAEAFDSQQFLELVGRRPSWLVEAGRKWPAFELIVSTKVTAARWDTLDRLSTPTFEAASIGTWGPAEKLSDTLWTQIKVNCWALRKSAEWTADLSGDALYLTPPQAELAAA
jgi:hypothetical protein